MVSTIWIGPMADSFDDYNECAFDIYEPPPDNLNDPHSQSTRDLSVAYNQARQVLPYRRQKYIQAFFNGHSPAKCCELAGLKTTPAGIRKKMGDPQTPEGMFATILRRVYLLNTGPTIAMRKAMLWDIALNHHEKAPAAAIKAVDVLNRMDNLYVVDPASSQVTINTNVYNDINWADVALISQQKVIEHEPN